MVQTIIKCSKPTKQQEREHAFAPVAPTSNPTEALCSRYTQTMSSLPLIPWHTHLAKPTYLPTLIKVLNMNYWQNPFHNLQLKSRDESDYIMIEQCRGIVKKF
jgi:hypothetical protein